MLTCRTPTSCQSAAHQREKHPPVHVRRLAQVATDPFLLEVVIAEAKVNRLTATLALDPHSTEKSKRLALAEGELRRTVLEAVQRGIPWADIAEHGLDVPEEVAKERFGPRKR